MTTLHRRWRASISSSMAGADDLVGRRRETSSAAGSSTISAGVAGAASLLQQLRSLPPPSAPGAPASSAGAERSPTTRTEIAADSTNASSSLFSICLLLPRRLRAVDSAAGAGRGPAPMYGRASSTAENLRSSFAPRRAGATPPRVGYDVELFDIDRGADGDDTTPAASVYIVPGSPRPRPSARPSHHSGRSSSARMPRTAPRTGP